jgi:Protein of unknown function (DUF1360)
MDSIYFRFLIAALATWRIAFLLVREVGPGGVFSALRDKSGKGFLGALLSCVKCVGTWIAIPFSFFVNGSWLELVVIWLALSGVTALIDEWTRPPFEWQGTKDDGMLRTDSDRTAK